MIVSILMLIGLAVLLVVIRAVARSNAEKSGMNICPKCRKEMELGVRSRYYCPYCGYKQPSSYF